MNICHALDYRFQSYWFKFTYPYSCTPKCLDNKSKLLVANGSSCINKTFIFTFRKFAFLWDKHIFLYFYHLHFHICTIHNFKVMINRCKKWINTWYFIIPCAFNIILIVNNQLLTDTFSLSIFIELFHISYILFNSKPALFFLYKYFPVFFYASLCNKHFLHFVLLIYPYYMYL